jgi:SAM-dependent methyltransferase
MSTLDPALFDKYDRSSDFEFYQFPRKVVHIDDGAIKAVTQLYRELLPSGGAILDLMSSWRSHLPAEMTFSRVAGLGMNAEEMRDNPQLIDFMVCNLNDDPTLPYEDQEFDAVVCCVSVQYLQKPFEVFAEVRRVLQPGGPFVVTFSNRCFPTKAVNMWHQTDDAGHVQVVSLYFEMSSGDAGGWRDITSQDRSPKRGDPLYAVWAYASAA